MGNVKIEVAFYNKSEDDKFKSNYPDEYEKLTLGNVKIPVEDFKTYFLFRHQFVSGSTFTTFQEFVQKLKTHWGIFDDYYHYNSTTEEFNSKHDNNNGNTDISESLGVAGALSLSSYFFLNITQADWRKIPVQQTTDLDFEHACSDTSKYYIVEAKGAIVADNRLPSAVSYHKTGITSKKEDPEFFKKYNVNGDVCYAIITVAEPTKGLKAWIVDPPTLPENFDKYKYKLLSRLYFYFDYCRIISPRSYLSILLANRLVALERASNYRSFDGVGLYNSSFKKINIGESFLMTRSYLKSVNDEVENEISVAGITIDYSENQLIFLGMEVQIMRMLVNQKFREIVEYKTESQTFDATVNCKLKTNSQLKINVAKKLGMNDNENEEVVFNCQFSLTKNSAGIIFGRASLENIQV